MLPPATNPLSKPKPTVLVVDDSPIICMLFHAVLTRAGYPVATFEYGGPALEQMRASPQPLIVLLGLVMPAVDGEQVLEAVAADPILAARHRLIMVTASTERASGGRVAALRRQLGVPLIPKPFTVGQILAAVAEAAATIA